MSGRLPEALTQRGQVLLVPPGLVEKERGHEDDPGAEDETVKEIHKVTVGLRHARLPLRTEQGDDALQVGLGVHADGVVGGLGDVDGDAVLQKAQLFQLFGEFQ